MRLESLEIRNIRTYGHARVAFQPGVTLFEGDVGCGKSSLLYAIEFALFGLSDLKAGHLLAHGQSQGSAELTLDVNGKKVTVYRQLERKTNAARQAPGWIQENGVRTEYSPEELKARMLDLLGFRENPSSRAASWIFRYAVFTPQEQMKEILQLGGQERLQTLRKAFGVEAYRTAQEHAGVVQQRLREMAREMRGQIMDVPALQERKTRLEQDHARAQKQAEAAHNRAETGQTELASAQRVVDEKSRQAMQAEREAGEVPLLEKTVRERSAARLLLENESRLAAQKSERAALEKSRLEKARGAALSDPGQEWEKAQAALLDAQKKLGAAEHAADEHAALKTGTCPTCGQSLPEGLSGKIQNAQERLDQCRAQEAAARQREGALRAQNRAFSEQQMTLQRIEQQKALGAQAQEQQNALGARIAENQAALEAAEKEREAKKHHIENARAAQEALQQAQAVLRKSQEALSAALSEKAARLAESAQILSQQKDVQQRLDEKADIGVRLKDIEAKTAWVADPFVPAVAAIEEHVLRRINHEFNRLFSGWFAQLLETQDLAAEVDASFTPQIRQQGFEQDYAALSGGEKSALALAYRLALNTLVRQTTASLKDNLLILDEPTDGFSKEQLSRMRQVLQEAGAQQVLLVSHERELESLCDQVYLVEKKDGQSTIKEA